MRTHDIMVTSWSGVCTGTIIVQIPKQIFRITNSNTTVTYFMRPYSRNVGVPFSKSNVRPVDFDLSLDASSEQDEGTTCFQLVYLITQHPKPTPYFTFALDKVSGTPNNKQSFKSSSLSILTMTFRWSRVFHTLGNRNFIRYSNNDPPDGETPSSLALSRWIRIKNLRGNPLAGVEENIGYGGPMGNVKDGMMVSNDGRF